MIPLVVSNFSPSLVRYEADQQLPLWLADVSALAVSDPCLRFSSLTGLKDLSGLPEAP